MGLTSPWFLAGFAAVALPIYFHLLKKHRSTPLPFSSLMFFERRTQSSIQHRRLQYLLLFALRALLLILLALAFAGPFVNSGPAAAGGGERLTLLAIDNSFSMRRNSHLDEAKRQAVEVIAGLGANRTAQVLSFARNVSLMSEATTDQAALRGAVAAIRPTDSRGSYGDLARALRSVAQSSRLPVEVHLFSDLQKSSMPAGFAELALPPGVTLKLHPLAGKTQPNWTVESVSAPPRVDDKGTVKAQATIAGFGTQAAALRATLSVNGRAVETKSVEVPAGARATVDFAAFQVPHGVNRCEVRIDSGDAFAGDDLFRFAVEKSDPARVLLVHEQRDTRSALYVRAALEAGSQAALVLDPRTPFDLSSVNPAGYGFVILSNVSSLPGPFEEALKKHVRAGGAVMIALGPATAARGRVPVLETKVLDSRYSSREGQRFQTVDWLDTAHPSIQRANRWEGVKFYQLFRVEDAGLRVLARVADQTPVLLEKQEGSGRVLLFTSTLDNISNDFPLHPAFVPFVEQTARYLSGLDEGRGSIPVDSYYELRRASGDGGSADVLDPEGRRVLDLSGTSNALGFSLAQEGYYEIRRGTGRRELVAANADRRESNLEIIPQETLSLWQKTGDGQTSTGSGSAAESRPNPLWWYVLFVAFLLALAESYVAAGHLSVKKEAA